MSEIGLTQDEYWDRLEELGVIEWIPAKSFFLTEKMLASLKKTMEMMASSGIDPNDIKELPTLCTWTAVTHLERVTPEEAHFFANFLFKWFNEQITMEMEDRFIRPGFRRLKKEAEG